jgi:hypothetical protein
MTVSYNYATTEQPVKYATVVNPEGYYDLIINKSKNGKAIRISNRIGSDSVNVAVENVGKFIEALTTVQNKGVNTSVNDLPYNQ